tara:strand:+ start:85 stop:753 length:669 start_codon:yes stop_codon:yes gene_type:complete
MDRSYFSQLFPTNLYFYDVIRASTHFSDLKDQIDNYLETASMGYMKNWGKTHKLSIESFDHKKGTLDLIEKIPAFKSVIKEGVERYIQSCFPGATPESFEKIFNNCYVHGTWITQLDNDDYAHKHHHMPSQISGVYYHSVPKEGEGGEIYFDTPVTGQFSSGTTAGFGFPQAVMRPEEGMMILFPSFLEHGVRTYSGDHPRISLSFNLEESSSSNPHKIPLF